MKIALASCSNLPDWEVDDQPLFHALNELGIQSASPSWDDSTVDWSAFDGCLIRTTWDYTAKPKAFVAWAKMVSTCTQLYNPPDIVEWNLNKYYLHELSSKGVSIAPTEWIFDSVDLRKVMSKRGWEKAFLKPIVGASAENTLRFDFSDLDLAHQLLDKVLPQCGMMLQPYLQRVETEGEYSLIYFDNKISHCVRKVPVKGDYRVQDDYGAKDYREDPPESLLALGRQTMNVIGRSLLYARVDALRGDDGEWFLNELELIEPSLFFRHCDKSAGVLANALCKQIESGGA